MDNKTRNKHLVDGLNKQKEGIISNEDAGKAWDEHWKDTPEDERPHFEGHPVNENIYFRILDIRFLHYIHLEMNIMEGSGKALDFSTDDGLLVGFWIWKFQCSFGFDNPFNSYHK